MIPGEAYALVSGTDCLKKVQEAAAKHDFQVTATEKDGNTEIFSQGIAGHAAYPEGRRNAIGQLLIVLKELGATGPIAA